MTILVAFDGIDGAGKSSLLRATEQWLRDKGRKTEILDFGSFPAIKPFLKKATDGSLAASKEAREYAYLLEGILTDFEVVRNSPDERVFLIDRYTLTYMSYGVLNGANESVVRTVQKILTVPVCHFYLDLDPEVALTRILGSRGGIQLAETGEAGTLEQDRRPDQERSFVDFQSQVRGLMLLASQENPKIVKLDATEPTFELLAKVANELDRTF